MTMYAASGGTSFDMDVLFKSALTRECSLARAWR